MRLDARWAVAASFFLNGFALASWVSRVPHVRDQLQLSNSSLGLLLLCAALASVIGLPASAPLIARWGVAAVVRAGSVMVAVGIVGLGTGVFAGTVVLAAGSLAVYGMGTAVWDISMNVEAAAVEQSLGRSIMPRFHAAFSLGTVAGAGSGAAAVALGLSMPWHMLIIATAVLTLSLTSARHFLLSQAPEDSRSGAAQAWREPHVLLIGLMVLALALTEGVANDWLALALKDGYGVSEPLAVLGFATFLASMTVGRMVGPVLLDRFGRVPVLWSTMALAALGVLAVVFGEQPVLVVPGIVMWGLGASLGFPVGMSAAADDPQKAAARVSVVSTLGYAAFLMGPPLLGFLADHVGVLHALLVISVLLVPAALVVPSARERTQTLT